jgi:hypothetical protein
MRPSCFVRVVALVLLAVGCSDQGHPTAPQPPAAPSLQVLRWAGSVLPRFTAATSGASGTSGSALQPSLSDGLSLDHNSVTFWAVRGAVRSVQINYLSSTGDTSSPFLQLAITDPVYVPGRGQLAVGDSVLVTVTIDPVAIKVSLEPTGMQFGNPAQMRLSYGGAGGDMNGDGVVDSTDARIEAQLLGLWYREGADSEWTRVTASQSVADQSFVTALKHFSDYEVSFTEYAVSW